MASLFVLLDIVGVVVALWLVKRMIDRRKLGPSPPGPRPLPLLGNILDLPDYKPWETFFEWGKRYGPLVHLDMFGQPLIIINSHEVATDLLDKRSSLYSDRQQTPSATIIGYTNTFPMVAYGDRLREQRRMLGQSMGTRALVEKYGPLEEQEAQILLQRILRNPSSEHILDHIKTYTGAIMLLLMYGYQMKRDGKDELLAKAFVSVESFGEASLPGKFLVDAIPALRYVPPWFPGTGWQNKTQHFRRLMFETMDDSMQYTKDQMAKGTAIPSFVSRILEDPHLTPEKEDILRWTAMSSLGGGIDTTMGTIYAFFLAMTLYPEVQRKAHAEIDAVVGQDRLPTFQDRDNLPYINALCSELFRWLPVGPVGVPHRLIQDDEYNGYFFPKGTVFIANIWGILHDPERYPNPYEFSPERYLKDSEKQPQQDPRSVMFGYGRRSCPGMHIADASLYIVVAHFVAAFTVEKKMVNGVPITPVAKQANGLISCPEKFDCVIKPRNAEIERLIHTVNEYREHDAALV